MANRIEIELTSSRQDGSWTWRAKGARHPRGTVAGGLLPDGARLGDVLRAEIEPSLDGVAVIAVVKERTKSPAPQRLEILGGRRPSPGVTTTVSRRSAPSSARDSGTGRRQRSGQAAPPGRTDHSSPRLGGAAARGAPREDGDAPATAGARGQPGRRQGPGRQLDAAHETRRGAQRARVGQGHLDRRSDRGEAPRRHGEARFVTGDAHRKELLATLRPEQVPVAEQLLQGGMPAVRKAISAQSSASGRAAPSAVSHDVLVTMAEELLPKVNLASWLDRAEAATRSPDEVPLRDLRSIVTAASAVILDEGGRAAAAELRSTLQRRVAQQHERWQESIIAAVDRFEIVPALERSARPPEPAARLSAEIAMRLSTAAGQAMNEELAPTEWLVLLGAVLVSPVRRTVRPAGLPREADAAFREECRRVCGHVPALARLLGIPIPPPPGPSRGSLTRVVRRAPNVVSGRPGGAPRQRGSRGEPGPAAQRQPDPGAQRPLAPAGDQAGMVALPDQTTP